MEKILGALNLKLITANKHQEILDQYKKLSNDEERVVLTFRCMLDYDIVPQECGDKKNAGESEKLRKQGNEIFVSTPAKSSNYVEAIKLYTKSIAYAPYPSEQLALSYANRSAVLMQVHKYEECIRDVDRALSLSYPDHLRSKLYVRKAQCLSALKDPAVKKTIEEARYWLEKMAVNDVNRKKLTEKLASPLLQYTAKKPSIENCRPHRPLPKIKTQNSEVPCASSALKIKYNNQYGRHVVATRNINPGEVIAVEKAYSLLLAPDNIHTHCSNCLEVSWANIPCDYCTYSMYCSEECKADDWMKFHHVECAVFPSLINLNFNKLDLFSLRLVVQAIRESNNIQELRDMVKEVDDCNEPRIRGFSKNGILESDKYRSIVGLVTNTEKRSVPYLFRRSMDSCFIVYFLATYTNMFGSPLDKDLSLLMTNMDVIFVGGLILRHQLIIPSNIHRFTEECGVDSVERGIAAMPFLSLFNHSCNPNIHRISTSKHMIVHSMYPIAKGEQVFDNYGMHYAMSSKDVRQKKLLKQYHIKCDCLACEEDWPLYMNLRSFRSLVKCKDTENKVNGALKKFSTYFDLAEEGDIFDKPYVLADLLKMVQVLYDNVQMPCVEMCNVVETLKRVYDLHGNQFKIPEL